MLKSAEKGTIDVAAIRREYGGNSLDERTAGGDPIELFRVWFEAAMAAGLREPTAVALATVGADGAPAARMVLMKGFDARGFTFYSNFNSRKGRELAGEPRAALLFWWDVLERQVRIEGVVERASDEESDAYFASRPIASQLGAWASEQSEVLPDRMTLEARVFELMAQFAKGAIPRPPHWGGFRLVPREFEFWQGRESRLHDRLRYRRAAEGGWKIERLSP